ncbi:zeta toxin family protein [Hymenobacter sp. ISL-91]|uniref:zeta toxin family protein n=1 Tax=Hymenobacter sp. ISL-91 TaxID=2819151 RepID=UPI001BEBF479|nr:zeta toxin family protein [Hymenobacter sp. ISL-91]MBT2557266.1 zeta toxin family protein [Hymenobacter sp. ISL-91]
MKILYILAGCNGAGKTTAAYALLPNLLDCREFVNADEIARGLSPFQPEAVSVQAGRLMLTRLRELLAAGETFALETTLATRHYLAFIREAQARGYTVHLLFFWLSSVEAAVERVRVRVLEGGHNIPEDVIRRRYELGLQYFFGRYQNAVDSWTFIDNTKGNPKRIAECNAGQLVTLDPVTWQLLTTQYA